jgi:phytoene dehydrogenase-like protein
MPDYDTIIVGGGHNGLVCAGYLARAGQRVAVLEKYPVLGGYTTTEEPPHAPGYHLNIGALEHVAVFDTPLIKDLELERYGLRYLFREALYLFPFRDGTDIPVYRSVERTAAAIAEISPRDAEVYPHFVEFSNAFLGILGAVSLVPPPTFGELAALMDAQVGLDTDQVLRTLLTSPQSVLDEWFDHPKVKAAIGYYGAHTQTAPSQIGAGFAPCILASSHTAGAARPEGGTGELCASLARAIAAHGGTVRTGAEVRRILVQKGRVAGVELTGGEQVSAARVVAAIDARRVFLDLVEEQHTTAELRRQVRNIRIAGTNISEFKIDAALNGPLDWSRTPRGPEFAAGMNLLCPSLEYLEQAFGDIHSGRTPENPAMMVCMASALDPTLAPPGKHTLWLSAFAPFDRRDGRSWDEAKEEYAERLLDVCSQYVPNIRAVLGERILTAPLDWYRRTGSIRANPNHLDMTLDQILGYRPTKALSQYRTPVGGLYLSGSGTHPGGGVSGNPGYNTAQVVLQDLGLVPPPERKGLRERVRKLAELFQIYRKLRKYL